jgi:hypothetical protein
VDVEEEEAGRFPAWVTTWPKGPSALVDHQYPIGPGQPEVAVGEPAPGEISVGQTVFRTDTGEEVTVTDTHDRPMLTVKNAMGAEFWIGREAVSVVRLLPGTFRALVMVEEAERYSPFDLGRHVSTKKGRQKARKPGESEPPHLALKNLDAADEGQILSFVTRYGLLGLEAFDEEWGQRWNPPFANFAEHGPFNSWFRIALPAEGDPGRRYALPLPSKETWKHVTRKCEPVDAFREATAQYQKTVSVLAREGGPSEDDLADFSLKAQPYSKTVSARPVYERGKVVMGWNVPSLLGACYFRWVLELTEGKWGFRHCKWEKCNRVFLARHKDDDHCSTACRKADGMSKEPDRVLARELADLERRGTITREQRGRARSEIRRLWKSGTRKESTFREAMDASIRSLQPSAGRSFGDQGAVKGGRTDV